MHHPIILQPWTEFRIFRSQKYQECWFRHLHCERNDNFLLKTQYFIQKIRENPFVVSNNEKGKKNEEGNPDSRDSPETKKRLYRNAELIAKFYKYVDILPSKKNIQTLGNMG